MAAIRRVLGVGRVTVYRAAAPRGARDDRADDRIVLAQIRDVIRTRATYGAWTVRALVSRVFGTAYNLMLIHRVTELADWKLPRKARCWTT